MGKGQQSQRQKAMGDSKWGNVDEIHQSRGGEWCKLPGLKIVMTVSEKDWRKKREGKGQAGSRNRPRLAER